MIDLSVVFQILEDIKRQAIECVENPAADRRDAFEFGTISGMLKAVAAVRERLSEFVEAANEVERDDD